MPHAPIIITSVKNAQIQPVLCAIQGFTLLPQAAASAVRISIQAVSLVLAQPALNALLITPSTSQAVWLVHRFRLNVIHVAQQEPVSVVTVGSFSAQMPALHVQLFMEVSAKHVTQLNVLRVYRDIF